jgi:surface polysaccharide O-acyltransferase-like enzyme
MSGRIQSLDTLKGLALLAVVIIHIRGSFLTAQGLENGFFDLILFSVSRFGVPIFFLISGFLLKKKFEERDEEKYTKKYVERLFLYYVLATGLYFALQSALILLEANTGITLPRDISMETSFLEGLYDLVYTGTAVRGSLWFFPALAISTMMIYISEKLGKFDALLGLSVVFHIIGVLSNTYAVIDLPVPARDALFFGLVFTSIGFKLGENSLQRISDYSSEITVVSAVLLILNIMENLLLMEFTGSSFIFQDYSFLTLPFAVSIFLLGLSRPGLGLDTRINLYGKYTLLGYIFHQIIGGALFALLNLLGMLFSYSFTDISSVNLVLTALTYLVTMEAVILYRRRF